MHSSRTAAAALLSVAATCFATAPGAHAQTFFPNDAVIASTITGDAVVGYADASYTFPTNPTVSLVAGGTVMGDLNVYNGSVFTLNGGTTGGNARAYGTSDFTLTAGTIGQTLGVSDNSVAHLDGGTIAQDLFTYLNSTTDIRGGHINGIYVLTDNSVVNFFGTGLSSSLVDANFNGGTLSQYQLSGTLVDGTSLDGKLLYTVNGTNARFTLQATSAPEPASFALIGPGLIAGVAVFSRRGGFRSRRVQMRPATAA